MRFDEEWISTTQLELTAKLAGDTNHLDGHAVEIGVHQGRSAVPIANAVYPGTLHAVDNWKAPGLGDAVQSRDNHAIFLANARQLNKGNVMVWRMDWRVWARYWRLPIRFIHIDGYHTALEVASQIRAVQPWLVHGGVVCGDDYHQPPVAEGVSRCISDFQVDENLWWARASR